MNITVADFPEKDNVQAAVQVLLVQLDYLREFPQGYAALVRKTVLLQKLKDPSGIAGSGQALLFR